MTALRAHAALLAAGGEIITASARQAQVLKARLGRERAQGGESAWPTPPILPLGPWLERAVRRLDERPALLEPEAASRLWQLIVEQSAAGEGLISVSAAAGQAERACQLLADWCIPVAELEGSTPEQVAFRGWAEHFRARCRAGGFMARADLAEIITANARELFAGATRPIGLHGFGAPTPSLARLLGALNAAGTPTSHLALEAGPAAITRFDAPSPTLEFEALTGWLQERLGQNPDAQLGVIVPDLSTRGAALQRLLTDRLAPALKAPGAIDARPFAFGRGRPLAEFGVVSVALDALSLGGRSIDLLTLGRVLRSPYLRTPQPELEPAAWAARSAALDAELRRLGSREIPAEEVLRRIEASALGTRALARSLGELRRALGGTTRRNASGWAEIWPRALRAVGWPLGRELGRLEYQAARGLYAAFERFAGLGRVLSPLGAASARAELEALVAATPLEPAIGAPPVLVLDALEDPGLPFDGLWVAGLTADRFPVPSAPNPFLPERLQRSRGMPGGSAEARLAAARAALAGFSLATPELVLSVAREDGDTRLLPSGVLPAAAPFLASANAPARARQIHACARLVAMPPGRLPAIAAGVRFAGGVGALERQSACPFKAGAESRLGAQPLEIPGTGLPRRVRGDLAHEALARFWRGLGDQAALASLGEPARAARAREAVTAAFGAYRGYLPGGRLRELEERWLTRAILELAAEELKRQPFTVLAVEERQALELASHPLSIRLDRLDRLDDGTTVILDYKTGRATPKRWVGARPDTLQLAVYAAYRDEPPAAVAIARLPLGLTRKFVGLAEREGILPEVRSLERSRHAALRGRSFASVLAEWRAVATGLATEFAAGEARVDPAEGACEYCALAVLCRIDERSLVAPLDPDAGDSGGEG